LDGNFIDFSLVKINENGTALPTSTFLLEECHPSLRLSAIDAVLLPQCFPEVGADPDSRLADIDVNNIRHTL
jgi:hypothetical protein